MSRAKGNRFERDIARRLIEADGADPHASAVASSTGRVGHLDIGADIITRRFVIECKNRESISIWLWRWIGHLAERAAWREHIPILVVKRNHHQPLVVIELDYFETLLKESNQ